MNLEESIKEEKRLINENYYPEAGDVCKRHNESLQDLWDNNCFICESCLIECTGEQND